MKMKRSIAMFIALVMSINVFSVTAFAQEMPAETNGTIEQQMTEPVEETIPSPDPEAGEPPVEETIPSPDPEAGEPPVEETIPSPDPEAGEPPVEEDIPSPSPEASEQPGQGLVDAFDSAEPVCGVCGEAHKDADCPVAAVTAILDDLPTTEELREMDDEAFDAAGAEITEAYEQYAEAYAALSETQQELLPDEDTAFAAWFEVLNEGRSNYETVNGGEITDLTQIGNMAGSYILTEDTTYSEDAPVGYNSVSADVLTSFTGTLDGQGHTITITSTPVFNVNNSTTGYSGLFAYSKGATFKNINIVLENGFSYEKNIDVQYVYMGGLVAYDISSTFESCTVKVADGKSMFASLDYRNTRNSGASINVYLGGLVGRSVTSGSYSRCSFDGTLDGQVRSRYANAYTCVGGLVGSCNQVEENNTLTVNYLNCSSTGSIKGYAFCNNGESQNLWGLCYVGGLLGEAPGRVSLQNCYSLAKEIYANGGAIISNAGTVTGAGGLVGQLGTQFTMDNCYYGGAVPKAALDASSSTQHYAGMLVARDYTNASSVTNCWAPNTLGARGSGLLDHNNFDKVTYFDTATEKAKLCEGLNAVALTSEKKEADYYQWEQTDSDAYPVLVAPTPHIHDEKTFELWKKGDSLPTDAGNYYLLKDVTTKKIWKPRNPNEETNLCLNGHKVEITTARYDVFYLDQDGTTLNIWGGASDGETDGEMISPDDASTLRISEYTKNVNVTLYSGTLRSKNETDKELYASCIVGDSQSDAGENCVFNLRGGTVRGALGSSAPIETYKMTVNLYGGVLESSSSDGIGVYADGHINLCGNTQIIPGEGYSSIYANAVGAIDATGYTGAPLTLHCGNDLINAAKATTDTVVVTGITDDTADKFALSSRNAGWELKRKDDTLVLVSTDFIPTVYLKKDGVDWENSKIRIAVGAGTSPTYLLENENNGSTFTYSGKIRGGTNKIFVTSIGGTSSYMDTGITVSNATPITVNYYTVTFDKGSGTGYSLPAGGPVLASPSYHIAANLPLTRVGYKQVGWAAEETVITEGEPQKTIEISAKTTLYPVWKLDAPTVTMSATYNAKDIVTNERPPYNGGDLFFTAATTHPVPDSMNYAYEWYRGSEATPIQGATSDSYTVTAPNVGEYTYSCKVSYWTGTRPENPTSITVNRSVEVMAAFPIITAVDRNIPNDTQTYDVSQLFDFGAGADESARTYTMRPYSYGGGEGTLDGNILTITKAGKFVIKVTVAAHGNYASMYSNSVLTVNLSTVTDLNLTNLVTAPTKNGTPQTTFANQTQYTGSIAWSPNPGSRFSGDTVYKATVTLTPADGYSFTGLAANAFTCTGATSVTNAADSGTVTITFPKTAPRTVSGISVKTLPNNKTYTYGNDFNPSGLQLTLNYEDGTTGNVTYSSENASKFSFAPAKLTVETTEVTVTYEGKTAKISGIKVNQATVAAPTVTKATYNGAKQTATVAANDKYSITNNGGTDVGTYDVVLTLNDKANYKWNSGDEDNDGKITLTFTIDPLNISDATVGSFGLTYTGSEQIPKATVTKAGLTATGSWSAVTDVADKTTFTASGNFTGTIANQATGMAKKTVDALDLTKLVTAPTKNGTPQTTFADKTQYTGTIAWTNNPTKFLGGTAYTATVTLAATANYTFTGLAANKFTYTGATVTNAKDSGVVTIVFPKTADRVVSEIVITGSPEKTAYEAGEAFDPAGLTITATYDDDTTAVITTGYTVTPDPLTAGTTSVTISFGGKSASVSGISVRESVTYNIAYNGNGATSGSMQSSQNVSYWSEFTLPTNAFKKTGYAFVEWNTKADGSGTTYADKAAVQGLLETNGGTRNLYAIWKKNTYTISYSLDGGTNSTSNPGTYTVTSSTITLKNPSKKGYTFAGWYKDSAFKTKTTQITKGSTGNRTLYAKWTKNSYKIAFNGNGSTSGSMTTLNCRYATSYTLAVNTFKKTGYTFAGWNTKADGSGTAYADKATVKSLTSTNGATKTLYATWKRNTYTIKYNLDGGTNSSSNPTKYYVTSSTITLKNPSKKGYTFAGWYKESTFKTKVTQIAKGSTGTKTLYAKWTKNSYKIAFNGNGSTSGSMTTLNCRYATSYTLTANKFKKTGYTFAGWNTKADGSGTAYADKATVKSLTSTNGATRTLYATWKKNTYTIKYNLNGGTNSSSNPTKYTVTSSTITLKTPKRAGYTFQGWYKESTFKTKVTQIAKGSTGTKTLYAKWKR